MSSRPVSRIDVSARARLLQIAKREGRDFNLVLARYYQERLLARLAVSPHRENFVLKGALFLFARASPTDRQLARPTRDIDLRADAISNNPEHLRDLFGAICAQPIHDGVAFDADQIATERIAEGAAFPGVRLAIPAALASTRGRVQIDVGFGDVVTPGPQELIFPALLNDMPAPIILAYPIETVIAEKFEAMITLSLVNSRMKDFYDLHYLARSEAFDGAVLQEAVGHTFARRGTQFLPDPAIFADSFGTDEERQQRWSSFLRRDRLTGMPDRFAAVMDMLQLFLAPLHDACRQDERFSRRWSPVELRWR